MRGRGAAPTHQLHGRRHDKCAVWAHLGLSLPSSESSPSSMAVPIAISGWQLSFCPGEVLRTGSRDERCVQRGAHLRWPPGGQRQR
jgi:hypothetical protein